MYSFRQAELVGKRFLCVRQKNSLRPNSRSSRVSNPLDYQWKVGVIRSCSEKDPHHPELKVLVEYDKEDWTTREWLRIHDGSWKIFLVEKTMVWSQRPDPSNSRQPLLWPALTFVPLVDYHGLSEGDHPVPVEFVGDHERVFVRSDECRPYGQDDDALQPVLRNNPDVMEELSQWQRLQKSQSILLDGPFSLTGFRVKVYRQTCRQWFSAVITAHDLISRELSVMDDTVLQTHRVDPRLVQVILLANEPELDSLLRGELVRVLPMRQHRHSQVIITAPITQTTNSVVPTSWQLYAGLSQASNSSGLEDSIPATYPVCVASTCTRPSTSNSPSSAQAATKARRKSADAKNRTFTSRRNTRSNSSSSPVPSIETCQQTPQTLQSTLSGSPVASPVANQRTPVYSSGQLSNKTSPVACTSSPRNSGLSMGSPSSTSSKGSSIKQPVSPKASPNLLQYNSSPASKARVNRSPYRSNPFCSSPDMSSMVSMASPISGMAHMGMCSPNHVGHSGVQSPHHLYSHTIGHLNLSPNHLYALQLQQQQQMPTMEQQDFLTKLWHQNYQNLLHQYQMQCYQLQLFFQQQELIQQTPLTLEQQNLLAVCYNQLFHQYQRAQNLQQLATSMCHPIGDQEGSAIGTLPERIQQKLRENQERQKAELQNLMPRLEPEQLQTCFTCLQQQTMTPEQIKDLYSLLIQQQEAQNRQTYAPGEQHEEERQKTRIHQYLEQSQEQLKKFLQLPKSLSFSQDAVHNQVSKPETSSSSPQKNSPSSSSSSVSPPSSASSFTVHYLPTSSDPVQSSYSKGKEKPKNLPCEATVSLEAPRQQASQKAAEIELKVTTTDEEQRSSSPHSVLEKLLQKHVQAVNRQETVKGRKARVSSTETKRQRKSKEATGSKTDNKDLSSSKKEIQPLRTSALQPDTLTENPVSGSSIGNSSGVQESLNSSVDQNFTKSVQVFIEKLHDLPRNSGRVNSHSAKEKCRAENEESDIISGVSPPLLESESAKVHARDTANEASPGSPLRGDLNTNHKEGPNIGANNIDSTIVLNGELTSLDENHSDSMSVTSVEGVGADNTNTVVARVLFKDPLLKQAQTNATTGYENASEGDTKEKDHKMSTLYTQIRGKTSEHKLTSFGKEKERLTTSKDLEKSLEKDSEREESPRELRSSSLDRICDGSEAAENETERNQQNLLLENSSTSVELPRPSESQTALSSGSKHLTNCFSVLSSNFSDNSDDLFSNKEVKTYSKKLTKRKSCAKEDSFEDNSGLSKVVKMDKGESSEIDIEKLVQENGKVAMKQDFSNTLVSTPPMSKGVSKHNKLEKLCSQKGKRSRKKPTAEGKLPPKKSKWEEKKTKRRKSNLLEKNSVQCSELEVENNGVVNSVSFVADQAVEAMAVNHSPTAKNAPDAQFEDTKLDSEKVSMRKERIREISTNKKLLKSKRQVTMADENDSADSSVVAENKSLNKSSFESVVDSVLDEEIPVIYNGEESQEISDGNITELTLKGGVDERLKPVKKPEKQRKRREPATKEVKKRERKKRVKKRSESDGDSVSPTSEQYFLQDHVCAEFAHLPKCRDCRDFQDEKTGFEFCRFNMFRRLRKRRNGTILAAGFQLPDHAAAEDLLPWVKGDKEMMDKETSLYVLFNIGDQFCSVMEEEKKAIMQAGEKVSVAYKRAVQGVREMCDVCATTIFNMHWVCHRCGFGVCLDCYNLRVKEREEQSGLVGKRVFEFKWLSCCPGVCHQPKSLSVTQIIPKTILSDLGDELHRAREAWNIGKRCPCKGFIGNECKDDAKITELPNGAMNPDDGKKSQNEANDSSTGDSEKREANKVTSTPDSVSSSANQTAMDSESSFDGSDDVNLICGNSVGVESPANREHGWLTEENRRNHFTKKAGFGLVDAKPRSDKNVSAGLSLLMDYNSSTEPSPCDSPAKIDVRAKSGAFNFSFASGLDLLALAADWDQGTIKAGGKSDDWTITPVYQPVATPSESTSAESSDELRPSTPLVPDHADMDTNTDAPHSWLCNGRLLRLHDPRSPGNMKAFEQRWTKGEPVLVSHVDHNLNLDIWTPKAFGQEFGSEIADVVNCRNGVVVEKFKVGDFWEGFESIKDRPLDSNGEPMLLKLKDWPPKDDFSEKLPTRFEDLMKNVPLPEYTRRDGSRNLVSRLPDFFVKPDLGPKMYNAYGSAACPKEGTTNLHLDMSDAVNVMVYVGVPKDQGAGEKERDDAIKAVDEACDESQRTRVRQETARIGALWHIYAAEDADKIRDCLREITKERKMKHSQHHDPIHDQCFYLDHDIRQRLKRDYGVEGWAICQCLGDAVFIPAGAPHQVRNLYSCVKVAEDFVSPERIDHCFRMTQEFRHLSHKHTNHEDKLQVKNIIYHAVKDALSSLKHYEQEETLTEGKTDRVT